MNIRKLKRYHYDGRRLAIIRYYSGIKARAKLYTDNFVTDISESPITAEPTIVADTNHVLSAMGFLNKVLKDAEKLKR